MAGIFAYCEDTQVSFVFQGGEPTLAGLDFFRNFCSKADSLNIKTAGFVFDSNKRPAY